MDVKVTQTNVLTVKASDVGLLPSTTPPYTLREDSGVIGGVNDVFALTTPSDADILVFDIAQQKYKNVPLTGGVNVTDTGVAHIKSFPNTFVIASTSTPTVNVNQYDKYFITGLSVAAAFGIPTGSPVEGQQLLFRIQDNGVAQPLTWNPIFRASPQLSLPSSTLAGKKLYTGFIFNQIDTKWDLLAVINGF